MSPPSPLSLTPKDQYLNGGRKGKGKGDERERGKGDTRVGERGKGGRKGKGEGGTGGTELELVCFYLFSGFFKSLKGQLIQSFGFDTFRHIPRFALYVLIALH